MASIELCAPPDVPAKCRNESDLGPVDWNNITKAGLFLVDRACERYLEALFWFDRAKDRTANQVGLLGAATSAILGLSGASADTIAITAAAFGLTTATIENIGSGLLYELDPAAVRQPVEKLQATYLNPLAIDQVTKRVPAFWAVQGYATQCLPPTIETEIVKAVRNAEPESFQLGLAGVPLVGQDVRTIVVPQVTDAPDKQNIAALEGEPGKPHIWGADGPDAYDCPGFALLALKQVGKNPIGYQNAQMLHAHFSEPGLGRLLEPDEAPDLGDLAFYGKPGAVSHVGICINGEEMIEAGGGDSTTTTEAAARAKGAEVRRRRIRKRTDLVCIIRPSALPW